MSPGPAETVADQVAAALTTGGLVVHTLDTTVAPIGPCALVGVPTITDQDGVCAQWTYQVPVLLLGSSTAARRELVRLVDQACAAAAAAHLRVVAGGPATFDASADATFDGYQLTIEP